MAVLGIQPMRILVTDGNTKHSIAIQHYILKYDPTIELLVHRTLSALRSWLAHMPNRTVVGGTLDEVLSKCSYDMVIPVGAKSVVKVAQACPHKAVLPCLDSVNLCLNKHKTAELARRCEVPMPRTWLPASLEEAFSLRPAFPCVIKPTNENVAKFVLYAQSPSEFPTLYETAFRECSAAGGGPPLVQEYVRGVGAGFFALYDRGQVKWVFMHQRIREWPVTGGASTAAKAFYHPQLRDYGTRLLDELKWHGVAMVEFKYCPERDQFWLIEINPKFWGSAELAFRAGVNFPAGLIRVYRKELLGYCEEYDRNLKFYWPMPDDLRALRKRGELSRIREYFQADAATNLLQHPMLDVFNLARWILR